MRWVVGISVLAVLTAMAVGEVRRTADPLAEWKESVTEWPESLGDKEKFSTLKWSVSDATGR